MSVVDLLYGKAVIVNVKDICTLYELQVCGQETLNK